MNPALVLALALLVLPVALLPGAAALPEEEQPAPGDCVYVNPSTGTVSSDPDACTEPTNP